MVLIKWVPPQPRHDDVVVITRLLDKPTIGHVNPNMSQARFGGVAALHVVRNRTGTAAHLLARNLLARNLLARNLLARNLRWI